MPRRNISSNTIHNQLYLIQIIVVISYALYCGVPAFERVSNLPSDRACCKNRTLGSSKHLNAVHI